MKVYLSRRYRLSASHRLYRSDASAAENAAIYGKCANPYGHGHNYAIEVCVSGDPDPTTGMVCDLVALDACAERGVLAEYDHSNLNLHGDFAALVPTTENFCIAMYERLAPLLAREMGTVTLAQITIEETSNNTFTYAGAGLTVAAKQWTRTTGQAHKGEG